jgi:phage shock protein A
MLKRVINLIKSLFGGVVDKLEDPELMLEQARRDMQEMHVRNRERAVVAITQKNNLQNQVDELQKQVDMLGQKAEFALKRGDKDLALQLLKEKQSYESSLVTAKETLTQAIETSEQVKVAIKREEEQLRQKTAETLALKAKWKQAQIQKEMEKQLQGMGAWEDSSNAFNVARTKINQTMNEASAMRELGQTNVNARLQQLEVSENDVAAQRELEQMEAKLGLGTTSSVPTTATVSNDIEEELRKLETKVGSGSNGQG